MDWRKHVRISVLIAIVMSQIVSSKLSEECSTRSSSEVSNTQILSRRKRFLVFPDGSSLQLVFCCQTAALIPIGDIFLYGNTAALSWNLPTDPELLLMFKGDYKGAQRRMDLNEIYYLDENGKVLAKVPFKRKSIINPAFAKRSVDDLTMTYKEKLKQKLNRTKMHEEQKRREHLIHMNKNSAEFHRNSRVQLYEKLEKLFTALGKDGRQCVLYKLCETKRNSYHQGTFLQELARIIFTLPKGTDFRREEHKEYDQAHHNSNDECSRLYPGCEDLVLSD